MLAAAVEANEVADDVLGATHGGKLKRQNSKGKTLIANAFVTDAYAEGERAGDDVLESSGAHAVLHGLAGDEGVDGFGEVLVGAGLGAVVARQGWFLVPVDIVRASYGPVIFLAGVALGCALAYAFVRYLYHGRTRRSAPWDCGYPWQTPRMQDSAEGFGQPIRRIFGPFFRIHRQVPTPADSAPRYTLELADRWWDWLYMPIARSVETVTRWVGVLQQGRISLYLIYSFATLLILLVFVL